MSILLKIKAVLYVFNIILLIKIIINNTNGLYRNNAILYKLITALSIVRFLIGIFHKYDLLRLITRLLRRQDKGFYYKSLPLFDTFILSLIINMELKCLKKKEASRRATKSDYNMISGLLVANICIISVLIYRLIKHISTYDDKKELEKTNNIKKLLIIDDMVESSTVNKFIKTLIADGTTVLDQTDKDAQNYVTKFSKLTDKHLKSLMKDAKKDIKKCTKSDIE